MKRFIIIVIIIIVLGLIKWFFLQNPADQKATGKPGSVNAVGVTAYIAKESKVENKLNVSGTVLANEEAQLVFEISGKILNMNLKEGKAVEKGDLLVKLNDDDMQAQFKKLKLQEVLAKDNEERQKKLFEIHGVSEQDYETSLNALKSAQADIEYTKTLIDKTELRAPFAGIIGLRNVSEGSYVSSATSIATIEQIDPIKIDFSVPEKYASLVQPGNTIIFTTEETRKDTFQAKVVAIDPKIDISTRTVKARALCPNKKGKIFPGSFAAIQIVLKETDNSFMIPSQALIPILNGYKIFIIKNGKAQEAIVSTGLRTESEVQVVSGIQQGDTIVTNGIMQLKTGTAIKINAMQ